MDARVAWGYRRLYQTEAFFLAAAQADGHLKIRGNFSGCHSCLPKVCVECEHVQFYNVGKYL